MTQHSTTDDAILASVAQHGGIRAAASALGIPYSTMQRKVAKAKQSVAAAPVAAVAPEAAPAVTLPPEMLSMLSAMAAAFTATQKPMVPVVVPAEPSRELVRGLKARRKERAERKVKEEEKPLVGGTYHGPSDRMRKLSGSRFFFTAAQNNTSVHEGFMASIATWRAETGGELLVGPFSYNKNGWYQPFEDKDRCYYVTELEGFLCSDYCEIAPGLAFCGQINTLPTAVDPLSGFEDFSRGRSGIFPHAKQDMKPMPALKGKPERSLYTTGCCTLSNYIQKKSGQKAEFHHVIGGLIVEVDDDGTWHVREVNAEADGSFQDLQTVYTPNGTRPGKIKAITWGDWHSDKEDEDVTELCLGEGGILDELEPEEEHHHDIWDFADRNHHNIKDVLFLATMSWRGSGGNGLVEEGVRKVARLLSRAYRPWCKQVLMVSNHCEAFEKWLREAGALDLHQVFSDDPDADNGLLEDLLYFGGCPEMFHLLPIRQAFEDTCRPLFDCATIARERQFAAEQCRLFIADAERREKKQARPRNHHRAFEGALASWRTWKLVFREVEAWL